MSLSKEAAEIGTTCKVVVFFEPIPLSDQFEQIMLTPKQAKAVRDAIWMRLPSCDKCGGFPIVTNEDFSYTFPNIPDSYDEKDCIPEPHTCPDHEET